MTHQVLRGWTRAGSRAFGLMMIALAGLLLPGVAGPVYAQEGEGEPAEAKPQTAKPEKSPESTAKPESPAKKAMSLSALLDQIEDDVEAGAEEQKKRLADFEKTKEQQVALLEQAKASEAEKVRQSEALERTFQENEARIKEHQALLKERMGSLGELFGVVRQVAGDTAAHVKESTVSAQLPGRHEFLEELGQRKEMPSIDELEKLWYALQQEMTEQGRVVRFDARVADAAGNERDTQVVRVGTFNLVADGKYLSWLPETGSLVELARQPETRYTGLIDDLEAADDGLAPFAIDPSRGSLLRLLVQTPDMEERLEAGGVVGQIILWMGGITAALGLLRLLYLVFVATQIRSQVRSPSQPRKSNPLGRVLAVYHERRGAQVETLERKLDEAVLRESVAIERFLWIVKIVSVVSPLLGLLGTVTGMIRTFQAITLFGAGDPKLMAGGISEALVTTMLGLVAAIPLVLLHSMLRSTARRMIDVLQEQAAGMVAMHAEGASVSPGPPESATAPEPVTAPAGGE